MRAASSSPSTLSFGVERVNQLSAKGYKAEARMVDASDASSVASLIDEVEKQFGPIDVLHYNAASMRKAALAEQPRDTLNEDLAVNIGGALAAAQAVSPRMSERGRGTILLTGGCFALRPHPDYLSLSIGKAGIRALAHGLFEPMKESKIHVATVTVATFVNPDSEDAIAVAERFWRLHTQPEDSWVAELLYPEPDDR